MRPIQIQPRDSSELVLWRATAELADALPQGSWTLVGAQMVFLLAYEHDLPIGRTSGDVDLMMDVRALSRATHEASLVLEGLGYELEPPTPELPETPPLPEPVPDDPALVEPAVPALGFCAPP